MDDIDFEQIARRIAAREGGPTSRVLRDDELGEHDAPKAEVDVAALTARVLADDRAAHGDDAAEGDGDASSVEAEEPADGGAEDHADEEPLVLTSEHSVVEDDGDDSTVESEGEDAELADDDAVEEDWGDGWADAGDPDQLGADAAQRIDADDAAENHEPETAEVVATDSDLPLEQADEADAEPAQTDTHAAEAEQDTAGEAANGEVATSIPGEANDELRADADEELEACAADPDPVTEDAAEPSAEDNDVDAAPQTVLADIGEEADADEEVEACAADPDPVTEDAAEPSVGDNDVDAAPQTVLADIGEETDPVEDTSDAVEDAQAVAQSEGEGSDEVMEAGDPDTPVDDADTTPAALSAEIRSETDAPVTGRSTDARPMATTKAFPTGSHGDPDARRPRICLMGEFSAGKSTLSNLLIGARSLPVNVTATQLPPVWISWGDRAPYRVDLDGERIPVDLNQLEAVPVDETSHIRIFRRSDLLEICDLIDMPGISDPNMSSEVWQRMLPKADAIVWCTHATQAWRQSEAAVWDTIPRDIQEKSILLLTRMDKILSERDRGRVLRRVAKETDNLFRARYGISLTRALAAGEDEELWRESGADAFAVELVGLIREIQAGLADPDLTAQQEAAATSTSLTRRPGAVQADFGDVGPVAEDADADAMPSDARVTPARVRPRSVQRDVDAQRRSSDRPARFHA